MIEPNNYCSYLTKMVSKAMEDKISEVELDGEMWKLAALRVWEVFCRYDDCPLTLENFKWTKQVALDNINEDYELANYSECSKICRKVEDLFNRIYDPTGSLLCDVSKLPEVASPRTMLTFISQLLETLKKKGINLSSLPLEDILLTYQTFDQFKKDFLEAIPNEHPRFSEIEGSINEAFAKVKWQNTLNKENISEFLELSRDFVIANDKSGKNSPFLKTCQWITDEDHTFNLSDIYNYEFDYRNLEVALPLEKIREIYKSHGVVQLRPIDKKATTLIIGCGNGRLSDAGGGSLAFMSENWVGDSSYGDQICKYSIDHLHQGVVTIDPSLTANPTLLAYFGDQPVSQLFDGQKFDRIIFEGYFDTKPQAFRKSDLFKLLSEDGIILIDNGSGPEKLDSWQEAIIAK